MPQSWNAVHCGNGVLCVQTPIFCPDTGDDQWGSVSLESTMKTGNDHSQARTLARPGWPPHRGPLWENGTIQMIFQLKVTWDSWIFIYSNTQILPITAKSSKPELPSKWAGLCNLMQEETMPAEHRPCSLLPGRVDWLSDLCSSWVPRMLSVLETFIEYSLWSVPSQFLGVIQL